MFGIGFMELCVIAVVALIFVGPTRLPEMMRQLGRFFVQVRRMTSDVRHSMDEVIREAEKEIQKEKIEEVQRGIAAAPEFSCTQDVKKTSLVEGSKEESEILQSMKGEEKFPASTEEHHFGKGTRAKKTD